MMTNQPNANEVINNLKEMNRSELLECCEQQGIDSSIYKSVDDLRHRILWATFENVVELPAKKQSPVRYSDTKTILLSMIETGLSSHSIQELLTTLGDYNYKELRAAYADNTKCFVEGDNQYETAYCDALDATIVLLKVPQTTECYKVIGCYCETADAGWTQHVIEDYEAKN